MDWLHLLRDVRVGGFSKRSWATEVCLCCGPGRSSEAPDILRIRSCKCPPLSSRQSSCCFVFYISGWRQYCLVLRKRADVVLFISYLNNGGNKVSTALNYRKYSTQRMSLARMMQTYFIFEGFLTLREHLIRVWVAELRALNLAKTNTGQKNASWSGSEEFCQFR